MAKPPLRRLRALLRLEPVPEGTRPAYVHGCTHMHVRVTALVLAAFVLTAIWFTVPVARAKMPLAVVVEKAAEGEQLTATEAEAGTPVHVLFAVAVLGV